MGSTLTHYLNLNRLVINFCAKIVRALFSVSFYRDRWLRVQLLVLTHPYKKEVMTCHTTA